MRKNTLIAKGASGSSTTRFRAWGQSAVVFSVAFSGVLLGVTEHAAGQANPPGCTFAGSGASIQPVPSGPVVHGATICYNVCYTVPNGIINSCNVVNFGANLFLPDGSSVSVVSGATIERGTSFCCGPDFDAPADPRCNAALDTGPSGDYCYVVNHADEVASFTGCPPVPSGSAGRVVAYTQGDGDSQTELGDEVAPCATANNIVQHACCEPCTGTCTNVNSAQDCPSPRIFTPNASCAQVTCTPLVCAGPVPPCEAGQICNPATGTCQNQPDAPLSTPCTGCPGGDTNCNNCHCSGTGTCVNNPEPLSTPCTGDTNTCTSEHCDGQGNCVPFSTVCVDNPNFCDDGDACTEDTCNIAEGDCCLNVNICICGDGNIDPSEFCDGASRAPGVTCTDACDAQCTCCGDGVQQPEENCDGTDFEPSGPTQTGEGTCRPDCTYCGDGTMNGGEQCDDGNNTDNDSCRNNCVPPRCGDGIIDTGEFCDGAAEAPNVDCTNACDSACTCCGDGVQQADENCDGTDFEPAGPTETGEGTCRSNCTYCGDGQMNGGEACDDGNNNNLDSCRNTCVPPRCGDGIMDPGEECDDNNNANGDGCSSTCTIEADFAGCTPGFWKQPHHLQYWTTYDPDDVYDDVFGITFFGDATLLEVLEMGGGGAIALGRHSVAALLNAASDEVDYAFTESAIIDMVQDAHASGDFSTAKNDLAEENERGCTVDKSGNNSNLSSGRVRENKP